MHDFYVVHFLNTKYWFEKLVAPALEGQTLTFSYI